MEVLGVIQPVKQYKTPEYVRHAAKKYREKLAASKSQDGTRENKGADIDDPAEHASDESEKQLQSNAEACRRHRVKKKLQRLSELLNIDHIRDVLNDMGLDAADLENVLNDIRLTLSRKVNGRCILELLFEGSKRQPESVMHVLVYHTLKKSFHSLTHACGVLGLDIKTLSSNYKDFMELFNASDGGMYAIKVLDPSGKEVSFSYIPEDQLHTILIRLPMIKFSV